MTAPVLSPVEVGEELETLPGWELDGDAISKTYELENYMAGLAFAAAVGTVAEAQNHHPDILIAWRRVKVSFTTHDAGSKITRQDIAAARAVEALGYPRKYDG
jgi:4a-hydroxytetrahydrobiopterin dehydratase